MLHRLLDQIPRRPLARIYVQLVTPLLLTASVAGVGVCQAGAPGPRVVHLQIDTDRRQYSLGDSITVRVAFMNTSGMPIRYIYSAPWDAARLVVSDDQGHVVSPTAPVTATDLPSARHVTLRRNETHHVLTWQLQEWFDLAHWGYRLSRPGRYTITGIPLVVSESLSQDYRTVRSNRATFTIVP